MSVLDKTLLTTVGAAKYAYNDAHALATSFYQIALGDNNGYEFIPAITDGNCVHEVYRANINSLTVDPVDTTIVIVQLVLPANVGGFTVREARIYDHDGVVMYTANPYFIKSLSSSDQNLLFRIKRSSTSAVTLLVDPSITLASQLYVNNAINTHNADAAAHTASFATKAGVQSESYSHAAAGGTADAITAAYTPAIAMLVDGTTLFVVASAANATTTPTFSPNGLTARTIVKANGQALKAGDISGAGHVLALKYKLASTQWILQNPDLSNAAPAGSIIYHAGKNAPVGYLKANGAAISRAAYPALFDELVTNAGYTSKTFTVTIAAPAVFTMTAHGFIGGERIRLSTTGALPTGLANNIDYYIIPIGVNTFSLSTTSQLGTAITTTGTQSGTHSYLQSLYGLGDGSTTFNVPDLRGEFIRAFDDSRGADAARTLGTWQVATAFVGDGDGLNILYPNLNSEAQRQSLGFEMDTSPANTNVVSYTSSANTLPNVTTSGMHSVGTANTGVDYARSRPRNVALLACIKY